MTITIKRKNRSAPKFYIYYNDWSGEILSIGSSLRDDSSAPFILIESEVAASILAGKANDRNYVVDIESKKALIKKTDLLRLFYEKKLFLIPKIKIPNWDIRATIYTENKKLSIEINPKILQKLLSFQMHDGTTTPDDAYFEFYITKKDRPEFLIDTIQINRVDLFKHERLEFNISHISKYSNLRELDIITNRYFENYYLNFVKKYVKSTVSNDSTQKQQKWQIITDDDKDTHISFIQTGRIVSIKTNASHDVFAKLKIYSKKIPIYVIGETPDELLDSFELDFLSLFRGSVIKYKFEHDISQVNLLHQVSGLKISKRKES